MLWLIALGLCAIVGYAIWQGRKSDSSPSVNSPPVSPDFQFEYNEAPIAGNPKDFEFPQAPNSVHYVTKATGPLSGTVRAVFRVVGSGSLSPTDSDPPARLRLYFQRKGDNLSGAGPYEHYRWWSTDEILSEGGHTLEATVDPAKWTSVFGKRGSDVPQDFADAIANAYKVGYTFGGSFAGHGVYVTNGTSHFYLDDFTNG